MKTKRSCLLLASLLSISDPSAAFNIVPSHHPTITILRSSITSCCASSSSTRDEAESSLRNDQAEDTQRRKTVQNGLIGSLLSLLTTQPSNIANAAAPTTLTTTTTTQSSPQQQQPIADFPMRKLHLPKGGLGRSYIILQLYINNNGPYDFMVDSGLTTELITPHLQSILGVSSSGRTRRGLSAGTDDMGGTIQSLVELTNVELCCGTFQEGGGEETRLPLEGPLTAIVTDFPQEHLDPEHDPVEGMLGMEVLERFDVDLDFPAGRLRLWKPGSVSVATGSLMTQIDAVVVNETRLLGFRVVSAKAPRGRSSSSSSSGEDDVVLAQPFLGLVDCGASFSVVNWKAASLLGLPPQSDKVYKKMPMVQGIGVDGRPQLLPTTNTIGLSFCGNAIRSVAGDKKSTTISFEAPPSNWKPWDAVSMAIGDLPVFSQVLGDGVTAYNGPAGIIGLDILSQRRVILETGTGRKRRIYVGNS